MEESQQLPGSQKPLEAVTYWLANQVAVTHHTHLDITEGEQKILRSLDLTTLNRVLQARSGYHLESFTLQDIARPPEKEPEPPQEPESPNEPTRGMLAAGTSVDIVEPDSLESPLGKYLFPHSSGKGTLVVSFFHLKDANEQYDGTTDVVHLINEDPDQFVSSREVKLIAAMPNLLSGGTPISVGCPATPPFPDPEAKPHLNWHIELPTELPDTLKNATGKGVHVFVLDTLPEKAQILNAATGSGADNTLLRDVATNVVFHYNDLAHVLDKPNSKQPATGSDIYNRLVGFRMNDHGIFIAGIIRDLAPGATVECIRVLNDYAVGNTAMLLHALRHIQNRLLPLNPETNAPGDLHKAHARVVVNLSLTVPPAEESLARLGYTDRTIAHARLGILLPMQALARHGVVFAASSGNASGPHDHVTKLPEKRLLPDYPAAFAYPLPGMDGEHLLPTMIPVGAVNHAGAAASYSNCPGPKGIGAYGGELPQPLPVTPDSSTPTQVQFPVDALRGVYTNTRYSALSKDDPCSLHSPAPISYPEYEPTPPATWAYWAGTSFATPIISALAARVMEYQSPSGDSVRQTLYAATPAVVNWTNLDTRENHLYGPMILVWQKARENT
jgi:hypothetical protein